MGTLPCSRPALPGSALVKARFKYWALIAWYVYVFLCILRMCREVWVDALRPDAPYGLVLFALATLTIMSVCQVYCTYRIAVSLVRLYQLENSRGQDQIEKAGRSSSTET